MASREPKLSLVSEPSASLRPESRDYPSTVNVISMSNKDTAAPPESSAKRLVVDASNISLSFDTADGKVDALSNVSLQIADGEFVSFIGP